MRPSPGTVVDQRGLPVEGVVVSDGLLTTLTDESGYYALESDLSKRRFVQVTIPAAYEIPVKNGIPQFWRRIPEGATEFEADFTLQARRKAASRYTVLMTADPQIRSRSARYDNFAFHSIDMYEDMCRDLRETAASITDRPVYGISLGDLVHNDMSLYPTYCAGIADFDFPVFSVIGNHDHVQNAATDREAVKKFEEYLGPTCYSVELGELHFIFLDNIVMKNNTLDPNNVGAYSDGLSDEAYSWLCNDLKYVDKDRTVMLCAHSSMFRKPDSEPADRDRHGRTTPRAWRSTAACTPGRATRTSISTTPIRPRSRRRNFPTLNRTSWPVRPGRCGSTKACRATERRGAIWSWRSTGRRSVGTISLILMKMTYLRGWIAAIRSEFTLPVSGTATDTSTPMSGTTTPAGGPSAIRTAAKATPK